jgi:hypothetical protein
MVQDGIEKKQGELKYLTMAALERTWRSSETLMDATKTYNKFKTEMFKLYLGSSINIFTIHHLDTLVGQCTQLRVQNMTKLGDFHLQFWTISKYLISKTWMSQAEQTQAFMCCLQKELENKVKQQLQIVSPQHNLQDPYELKDLFSFCLLGNTPTGSMSATNIIQPVSH